jgi:hypothetical protein
MGMELSRGGGSMDGYRKRDREGLTSDACVAERWLSEEQEKKKCPRGQLLTASDRNVLLYNVCGGGVECAMFQANGPFGVANITQVGYSCHHQARLSNAIVKHLHEPVAAMFSVACPVVNQSGAKMISCWVVWGRILWDDDIGKSSHARIPPNTSRLLYIGEYVIWVIQVKCPFKFHDVQHCSQGAHADDHSDLSGSEKI